jgi:hypothetical protein
LCTINQPSRKILQSLDRLILLGKGGKQLYFGKIGASCNTLTSYFERQGARACNADESPAEWMLEITHFTTDSESQQDWSEIWKNSPERQAMKIKHRHLKDKFSRRVGAGGELITSDQVSESAASLDAIELQRKLTLGAFHSLP